MNLDLKCNLSDLRLKVADELSMKTLETNDL